MTSEFGKGCVYCLGLFIAHEGRIKEDMKTYEKIGNKDQAFSMWFYAAADHLFELEIPSHFPPALRSRLKKLKNRVLNLRLEDQATQKDFEEVIEETKSIFMSIDRLLKVKPVKAQWS